MEALPKILYTCHREVTKTNMKQSTRNHSNLHKTRIAVVGTGMVGSSFAYAAMIKGLAAEIIMVDANEAREAGEVMDLSHALIGTATGNVVGGSFKDCGNVDIIVITAGAAQKPGETRLDLVKKNAKIMADIIKKMGKLREDTVVIVVANPVDIMTQLAAQLIKLPKGQVFGSGTSLDTSRLRLNISAKLGTNLHNVHGYVLGEHGDSEFVAWSLTNVSGVKAAELLSPKDMKDIEVMTMRAAYEIIQRKQATYYGIGVVVAELVEHVLRDSKYIVPVSTEPGAAYGIHGISIGVPAVLGRRGVEKVWKVPLAVSEMAKLKKSADLLKGYWKGVK
jgi:L-lactate dehydrogenase